LQVLSLDHVNIRTADVERLANFYRDALGFEAARHPAAIRPTVWLGHAGAFQIHLVQGELADASDSPRIEHFALRATGLESFLDRLRNLGIAHRMTSGEGFVRVNLRDSDGNRLHLDFDAEEYAA
jgi:catechol 2,3-dioxygenase-like lactoylglutathione lyase family enzyme